MNNLAAREDRSAPEETRTSDIASLAGGVSVTLVGKITGRGVNVLGQAALARFLGPELFGLYAIGLNLLISLGLVGPLGLDRGAIRFTGRYWGRDETNLRRAVSLSLSLSLLFSLVVATVLFVAAAWLEGAFQKSGLAPVIRLISLGLPLLTILYVGAAITTTSQQMRFSAYARDLAQPIGGFLLIVVFYLAGWRLWGAVLATVFSYGLAAALALYYVRRLLAGDRVKTADPAPTPADPRLSARTLLAYSLPTTMAGVFTNLTNRVDRLLVGYFRPVAEAGIYQVIAQSAFLFTTIIGAFNAIFMPIIADLYQARKMKELNELYKVATKWQLYLSLPLFLVMLFNPWALIVVVFGRDYADGARPLMLLISAQLVNVGTGSVGPLFVMTGHERHWLLLSGLSLAVNVILNVLFVPRWGLMGSAVASLLAVTLLFSSGLWQIRRLLGLWPYDRRYVKGLAASLGSAGALALLRLAPFPSDLAALLASLIVSLLSFIGLLLILGLDQEDRDFIALFASRLKLKSRPAG